MPACASFSVASGTSALTIAESRLRQPEAGAEAVGEPQVVLVDRLDADPLMSRSAGSVPTHENQAGDVSKRRAPGPSRSGGPNWSLTGRRRRTSRPGAASAARQLVVEDHERRPARAHQPLLGGASDGVEAARVEREPPDGVRRGSRSARRGMLRPQRFRRAPRPHRSTTAPRRHRDDIDRRVERRKRAGPAARHQPSRRARPGPGTGTAATTNSGSGASTREPSGIATATCEINPDTFAPTHHLLGASADERRELPPACDPSPRSSAPSSRAPRANPPGPSAAPPRPGPAAVRSSRCSGRPSRGARGSGSSGPKS